MANEKMNMNAKDAQSEMKGQFPDREEIMCNDCRHRDKTILNIGKKRIPIGVTKSFCKKYEAPPKSNGKPHEVLFENGICEYYEKDR